MDDVLKHLKIVIFLRLQPGPQLEHRGIYEIDTNSYPYIDIVLSYK